MVDKKGPEVWEILENIIDGHPVLLADWIDRDGLDSLKVKLRGNDLAWDIERLVRAGTIGPDVLDVAALTKDHGVFTEIPHDPGHGFAAIFRHDFCTLHHGSLSSGRAADNGHNIDTFGFRKFLE